MMLVFVLQLLIHLVEGQWKTPPTGGTEEDREKKLC